MSKQKPPNSVGKKSGFPYEIFWEEFAPDWLSMDAKTHDRAEFKALKAKESSFGGELAAKVDFCRIYWLLGPLALTTRAQRELAIELYDLAIAYLLPALRDAHGVGPRQLGPKLRSLRLKARTMRLALDNIDLNEEVMLGLLRSVLDNPNDSHPVFHFRKLKGELSDLERAAELLEGEIPKWKRGTSVKVLRTRWVEAAHHRIYMRTFDVIEVRQADTFGRNPRPHGVTAEVLFDYLALVDGKMTNAAKVKEVLNSKLPIPGRMYNLRPK